MSYNRLNAGATFEAICQLLIESSAGRNEGTNFKLADSEANAKVRPGPGPMI